MNNQDNSAQAQTTIYINNMTMNQQPQPPQQLAPQIANQEIRSLPTSGYIQNQYSPLIQMPHDPFDHYRKANSDYSAAKQYQKNITEFQEQYNLEAQ